MIFEFIDITSDSIRVSPARVGLSRKLGGAPIIILVIKSHSKSTAMKTATNEAIAFKYKAVSGDKSKEHHQHTWIRNPPYIFVSPGFDEISSVVSAAVSERSR